MEGQITGIPLNEGKSPYPIKGNEGDVGIDRHDH